MLCRLHGGEGHSEVWQDPVFDFDKGHVENSTVFSYLDHVFPPQQCERKLIISW